MTTLTIEVNANNDIFLPDGRNLNILSGEPAMVQVIRAAHLMRLGEAMYDVTNGVDYMGTVFTSPVDQDGARQSLANAILKKQDVAGIETLTVTIQDGVFDFEAQVVTIYGDRIKVSNQP